MGFARRRRRKVRPAILIIVFVIFTAGVCFSLYYFINQRMEGLAKQYEMELETIRLEQYLNEQVVYMPLNTIKSGTKISEDLLCKKVIHTDFSDEIFFSEDQIGSYAKIDMEQSEPILKSMVASETLLNDIRLSEFQIFDLPSQLKVNEFIDVRINFPNGEDYIVLSKKKVRNLNKETETIWLWLDEKELLEISSAVVDAYLHEGSRLYTTVYVEPAMQEAAYITYPVNASVLQLISDNPNIIEDAKMHLLAGNRLALEERLAGNEPDLILEETLVDNNQEGTEEEADVPQESQEESMESEIINTVDEDTVNEEILTSEIQEEGEVSNAGFFD